MRLPSPPSLPDPYLPTRLEFHLHGPTTRESSEIPEHRSTALQRAANRAASGYRQTLATCARVPCLRRRAPCRYARGCELPAESHLPLPFYPVRAWSR